MVETSAVFSDCGLYRYRLTRTWDAGRRLVFLMLNPSTADAEKNDPTVTRCIVRAKTMGFAGLEVINLFGFRSPYPANLYKQLDPIGPENDRWIEHVIQVAGGPIICAWGDHGLYRDRARKVLQLAAFGCAETMALGLTKHKCPKHPLHIAYAVQPFPWKGRK